jgi:hypothetical protein
MTRALLAHVPELGGVVLECCAGNGSIASVLTVEGGLSVITNDVSRRTDTHADASSDTFWRACGPVDWVITNPPYRGDLCLPLVRLAVAHARIGVATMLRLSFKEPTATGTCAVIASARGPRARQRVRGGACLRRPMAARRLTPKHRARNNSRQAPSWTPNTLPIALFRRA